MNQDNHQQQSTDFPSVPSQDVTIGHGNYNHMMGVDGHEEALPTTWIGHTTELGEWFEGNQHMMNVLEGEDAVDFSFLD